MKIYPNPSRSIAYVSIPAELKNGGQMVVRNKTGEVIEERSFSENDAHVIPVDLRNMPNGFYNISLVNESLEMSSELLSLVETETSEAV